MPKAISYIRFSSGKQLKGSSLERQMSKIGPWLERNPEYTLSDLVFRDLGVSGFKADRGHLKNAFGKLLVAVEERAITSGDVILVEAIDRAGRLDMLAMLEILTPILKAGVSLVTLDDGNVYNRESLNGSHIYMLSAKIQAAYGYSEALSSRMKASYQARHRAAKIEGKVPKRMTPVWLTTEGVLIEDIAPFVRQAFEDYASGLGERRIYERILKSGGDKHPEFVRMAPSTVKRWMRNRTAIGEWQGIAGVYPAVVSTELFYRVQNRLNEDKTPRSAPTQHPYTGLVVCAGCGKNFNSKVYQRPHKGQIPPPVMDCSSRARRGSTACPNSKSVPMAVIATVFNLSCWKHVSEAMAGQHLTDSQKREVEIDGVLGELSRKIARLVSLVAELDDDEDMQELTDTLKGFRAERAALKAEKDSLAHQSVTIREKITNSVELASDPLKMNALLQSVGYRIVCAKDGTIDSPVGTFHYQGWARASDSYKLLTPEGKLLKLPIERDGKEMGAGEPVVIDMDKLKNIQIVGMKSPG